MQGANTTQGGRAQGGFTLIEVLLSFVFIAVMVAIPLGWSRFSLRDNAHMLARDTIVQMLHKAQDFARYEKQGGGWGVRIEDDRVMIFRGDSFDGRIAAHDETILFAESITLAGIDEVAYAAFTGEPNLTGDIVLGEGDSTLIITLGTHGFIDY